MGQLLTFEPSWTPFAPPADMLQHWTLPDKYVNEQYQYSSACTSYRKNTDLLTNLTQQCWYVNQPAGAVSVGMNLKFANGQYASVAAMGNFSVYRLQVTFPFTTNKIITPMLTNGWLQLGNADKYGGDNLGTAQFDAEIMSKMPFTGFANWTQLIRRSVSLPFADTGGRYDLDTGRFYNNGNDASISLHTGSSASPNPWGVVDFYDSPGVEINHSWLTWDVTIKDDFKTYLEFKPDGDSIWVTLGIVTWGWGATEGAATLSSPSTVQPYYQDSDQFPVWTQ